MARVYVIKCNDTGLCKIGRSHNPERRLKQIESSSGFNCEIAHVTDELKNSSRVESLAHSKCNSRMVGEWFSCTTNIAISCVKQSCDEVGIYGDANSSGFENSHDIDFLIFWSVTGSFIDTFPLAVIKYALDTFDSEFSDSVLDVCNKAYFIGSGGDVGDFVDRLDVQCFFDEMIKQKSHVHDLQLESK